MKTIEHDAYMRAIDAIVNEYDDFHRGHIICLLGPSGVGKTRARHAALRTIFGDPSGWGRGRLPVVDVYALLPSNAYYSSRDMARTLVDDLITPDLSWMIEGSDAVSESISTLLDEAEWARGFWRTSATKRRTEPEYWKMVREIMRPRGCKLVSIDHAHALLKNRANLEPTQHTQQLLTTLEKMDAMGLMTGIPEATRLWQDHSEMRRRVRPVWFTSYSGAREEDHLHFARLLKNLSQKYPLHRSDLLHSIREELHLATAGIIGELSQLLSRAKGVARSCKREKINLSDIRASYYNEKDLKSLWADVRSCEVQATPGDPKKLPKNIILPRDSAATGDET